MALVILRSFHFGVDEHCHKATAVGNGELQSTGRSALVMTSRVIRQPAQHGWDTAIQAGGHHERHAILDLWIGAVGDDAVADDSDR